MRGFFISLGALLLTGLLLIALLASQEREEEQTRIELEYLQNRLAMEYLGVLESATIPGSVALTGKYTLATGSWPLSQSDLESAIRTSLESDVETEYDRLGLPFKSITLIDFRLLGWTQPDDWSIELAYEYSVDAESSPGIVWTVTDTDTVAFSVVGFEHPGFPEADYGLISRSFWGVNSSNDGCVLAQIDPSYTCAHARQLCHRPTFPTECI